MNSNSVGNDIVCSVQNGSKKQVHYVKQTFVDRLCFYFEKKVIDLLQLFHVLVEFYSFKFMQMKNLRRSVKII